MREHLPLLKNGFNNLLHGAPVWLVPVLALFAFVRPESATTARATIDQAARERVSAQLQTHRPLLSDLDDLAGAEKALRRIREANPIPHGAGLSMTDATLFSPLNGWEKVERTAGRRQATLDYFLGFGF